jgi:hypothetical protein
MHLINQAKNKMVGGGSFLQKRTMYYSPCNIHWKRGMYHNTLYIVGIDRCINYTLLPFSCQMIDLLLFNANSTIVQLYHGEITLIVNEMKMRFYLIWTSLIWLRLPFLRRDRRGIVLINTPQAIWYLKLLTLNLWCNCTFDVWLIYWFRCHVII